jgi:hypothetical protein
MKLIRQNNTNIHVSLDAVVEFESSIIDSGYLKPAITFYTPLKKYSYAFFKRIQAVLFFFRNRFSPNHVHKKPRSTNGYFAVLMGQDFVKCFPYFFLPVRKAIYMFDAWPDRHKDIRQFAQSCEIDHVFLSSKQAVQALNAYNDKQTYYWIPEGISPAQYQTIPFEKKNIDVLALGRRYNALHDSIVNPMKKNNHVYLYEKTKGTIIFPDRTFFLQGLAAAKISICIPSNITHPERTGTIETMTLRYLQSMISKCLVVGHAPQEMIELFRYNPVIELDMKNPADHLENILCHYKDYYDLIEKNYKEVQKNHTWEKRWEMIVKILSAI